MVACRTYLGGLGALVDVAAHEALPLDGFVALPYGAVLDLLEIVEETHAVMVLNLGDGAEMFCNLGESLFVGNLCGLGVLLDTLGHLLVGGSLQV